MPLFENEYTCRPSFSACSAGRVYSLLARKGLKGTFPLQEGLTSHSVCDTESKGEDLICTK